MPPLKRNPRSSRHQWATRIGWALILAAILAYTPYRFMGDDPGKRGVPELTSQLDDTNAKIAGLERDNAHLRREIHALRNDPAAVEDIARDQLGFVKSTDLVVRVKGVE